MGHARADWCDLLDERELVIDMNRTERLAMIKKNNARAADTLDDQAMRKYQRARREQDGYFDDFVEREPAKPQLVFKTHDGSTNPIAPLTANYVMPKADGAEHAPVMALADEVGVITGSLERRIELLEKRIAELESK